MRILTMLVPMTLMACSSSEVALSDRLTAAEVLDEGLTCEVIGKLVALDGPATTQLRAELLAELGAEGLATLVDGRARDCAAEVATPPVHVEESSITNTSAGEAIEETAGTGGRNGVVYRDSAATGWLCNSGASESPADYIGRFNLPGASANRGKLRVRGTNVFASCYLPAASSARVYSDNDVQMCMGYWRVFACAGAAVSADTAMWVAP